jgi:NTP pyrophosphatase (non-canonical NTP hydrolase)
MEQHKRRKVMSFDQDLNPNYGVPKADARPSLTFEKLRLANVSRCESPDGFNHPLEKWSEAEWSNATTGEAGEFAMAILYLFAQLGKLDNLTKKLIRFRDDVPGNDLTYHELRGEALQEIGDIAVYLDLMCSRLGARLEDVVKVVFNTKSSKISSPFRL